MSLTSGYTSKWSSNAKAAPFSPAFAKLHAPMHWCGLDLVIRVECTDGNITISTGDTKTHVIHVCHTNIVAIELTRNAICISDDDNYSYYRHVVTIKYTLSDGNRFCITINEDNYMNATTDGEMIVMTLYDANRKPTRNLVIQGKSISTTNADKYELLESYRGWGKVIPREFVFSNTYKSPKEIQQVKCIDHNAKAVPGTIIYNHGKTDMLIHGFDLICRLTLGEDKMLCKVIDVATKMRFCLTIARGEHNYRGPQCDNKKYYYNGPLKRNDSPIPFAIVTINYISFCLSHTEAPRELLTA